MTIIIITTDKRYTYWNVESICLFSEVTIIKHTDRPESQLSTETIIKIEPSI